MGRCRKSSQRKHNSSLLRRSETMSVEDKAAVQERLNMWDNILEQDPYLQKRIATSTEKAMKQGMEKGLEKRLEKGLQKGLQKGMEQGKMLGEVEGELNASRSIVLDIIDVRFPSLTEMAKRRVQKISAPTDLRQLAKRIVVAPDEKSALQALMSDAA